MELRPNITLRNRKTGDKGRYRMDQPKILIGRDKSSFVYLQDRTVSRRHAEIVREGTNFFLTDLKSGNQTFLNDIPLAAHEKALLNNGDRILVGDYELHFLLPSDSEATDLYEITDSDILEVKMVKKLMKALDREKAPSLEVVEGTEIGKRFVLEGRSQEILIGRDPACEFRIDSDVISRKHARVTRKFDMVHIEDLGSRNGVFVGRDRIQSHLLKDGDRIHLGTVVLVFRNPQQYLEEISPPRRETPPLPAPESPPPLAPKPPAGPAARVSKKEEGAPRVEAEESAQLIEEGPPPIPTEKSYSPLEIVMVVIGLLVLVGAIWGIFKIL